MLEQEKKPLKGVLKDRGEKAGRISQVFYFVDITSVSSKTKSFYASSSGKLTHPHFVKWARKVDFQKLPKVTTHSWLQAICFFSK